MLIECYAILYKQNNHRRVVMSSDNIIEIEETGTGALFQPFGCHCISCFRKNVVIISCTLHYTNKREVICYCIFFLLLYEVRNPFGCILNSFFGMDYS